MLGPRGTRHPAAKKPTSMRRLNPSALCLVAVLALCPASAHARSVVVSTGGGSVTLLDVTTQSVVRTLSAPSPTGPVAAAPDGRRAYVVAGSSVAIVDLDRQALVRSRELPAPPVALAISPRGGRLYAAIGRRLYVLDGSNLAMLGSADLKGAIRALAVSRTGVLGGASLAGNRVALVDLGRPKLLRRVKIRLPAGLAFDWRGRLWVASRAGRLYPLRPGAHKLKGKSMRLGSGLGGAVAFAPDGFHLAVGSPSASPTGAVVNVASGSVRRVRTGAGPGVPAWGPDGARIYMADRAAATVSVISPFRTARIGVVALPGSQPAGIVVQPGLARVAGTDGPRRDQGHARAATCMKGLGGDDHAARRPRQRPAARRRRATTCSSAAATTTACSAAPGDDTLFGGSGNDRISGGDGQRQRRTAAPATTRSTAATATTCSTAATATTASSARAATTRSSSTASATTAGCSAGPATT